MDKKTVSYKIDKDIVEEFNKTAKEKAINKSQWIENKMKEFIKENK